MTHHRNCDCYDCHRSRGRRRAFWFVVLGAAVVFATVFFMAGCSSTVTPAPIQVQQASFDQGAQNSGVIAMLPGNAGAIITPRARDRYNGLIAIYGRDLLPPIQADYGLAAVAQQTAAQTPAGQQAGTAHQAYTITAEALQKFILMNAWHRMGREPGKTKQP